MRISRQFNENIRGTMFRGVGRRRITEKICELFASGSRIRKSLPPGKVLGILLAHEILPFFPSSFVLPREDNFKDTYEIGIMIC